MAEKSRVIVGVCRCCVYGTRACEVVPMVVNNVCGGGVLYGAECCRVENCGRKIFEGRWCDFEKYRLDIRVKTYLLIYQSIKFFSFPVGVESFPVGVENMVFLWCIVV